MPLLRSTHLALLLLCIYPASPLCAHTFLKLIEGGPNQEFSLAFPWALSSNGIAVVGRGGVSGGGNFTTTGGILKPLEVPSGRLIHYFPRAVNDQETVVIEGQLSDLSRGFYTLAGGELTEVYSTPFNAPSPSLSTPSINNSGAISFIVSDLVRRESKVFLKTPSGLITVADQFANNQLYGPVINESGRVAFAALGANNRGDIYIGGTVPLTTLLPSVRFLGTTQLAMNDAGDLLYLSADDQSRNAILLWQGGAIRSVVTAGHTAAESPFASFSFPAINNRGDVAFSAVGHAGANTLAIYIGPDAVRDRVIGIGDPLFGSIVTGLIPATGGHLDDKGQILFQYSLADGRNGAALAVPDSTSTVPPSLAQGSVANGASFREGIVAGSWAQVKGTNLSPTTRIWNAADFPNTSTLPTSLDGIQVTVDGVSAAVYYISPTQISFQVPAVLPGPASIRVIRNGIESNPVTADIIESSPGLFTYLAGSKSFPAAVYANSTIVVGDPSLSGSIVRKATPGDHIALYATGISPSPAGTAVSPSPVPGVVVEVGTTQAMVEFAGLVAVGQFQINIVVPNLGAGEHPVRIRYNGKTSQDNVLLPVGP